MSTTLSPPMAMSSLEVPELPILPDDAPKVTVAAGAKAWILAVEDVKLVAVVSVIDPAGAVMLMAPAAVEYVDNALAPNKTLRPADKVMVPDGELTGAVMTISPPVVAEVNTILPAEVMAALTFNVRPAVKVMAPNRELTAALIVTSLPTPVEVIVTVPAPPALTAPLTVTDPALAMTVILPKALVVIPDVVTLPVDAV